MEWAWSSTGIAVLWLVLHSADYLLTITAARMYAQGDLRTRIDLGGRSLELNPVFQRAVNRGAWVSGRFLLTLVGGAVLLFACFTTFELAASADPAGPIAWGPEAIAGTLVVTRVCVISSHLQSLALFHRVLHHPAAAVVTVRYDRGTVFTAKRWGYLLPAALCGLAVLVTRSVFFGGATVGMVALASVTLIWQHTEARPPATGHPPQGAA